MKIEKMTFDGMDCLCCLHPQACKMAYIIYPMQVNQGWIAELAAEYGISIVVLTGMEWDDDLTPWKAPGVPDGSPDFKGRGAEFLTALSTVVMPAVESRCGFSQVPERTLFGVSLSGLFALWQWSQCDLFHNIATLSGSFWYADFVKWILGRSFSGKNGRCFMLLGDAEPHSKNACFASVGTCTEEIVDYLRRQGVAVTYNIVKGNHYQYPAERLNMAIADIYG